MLVHAIDIIIDLGVVRVISYYYYKQTVAIRMFCTFIYIEALIKIGLQI